MPLVRKVGWSKLALDRLPAGIALAYIDDIIFHSKSIEDHLDHVEQVMEIHAREVLNEDLQIKHFKIFIATWLFR